MLRPTSRQGCEPILDLLWPLVVTSSPGTMTVRLGLATFPSVHFTNWPQLVAATVIIQLPILVILGLEQRFVVRSIAASGIT